METDNITLPKEIVRKVNELFHLQENILWESKAIELTRECLQLRFFEGKLDVLRDMIGTGHGLDDFYIEKRIEKVEKTIETIEQRIEKI